MYRYRLRPGPRRVVAVRRGEVDYECLTGLVGAWCEREVSTCRVEGHIRREPGRRENDWSPCAARIVRRDTEVKCSSNGRVLATRRNENGEIVGCNNRYCNGSLGRRSAVVYYEDNGVYPRRHCRARCPTEGTQHRRRSLNCSETRSRGQLAGRERQSWRES